MNYFIITGTSRGLGEAFARELLREGNHLFCISRTKNEALLTEAMNKQVALDYLEYDLSQVDGLEQLMEDLFENINLEQAEGIYLINNAGTLAPIGPVQHGASAQITHGIQLNLLAPMILTSSFIKHTERYQGEKRVVNISSGAGKNPYFGWSTYCTTKAGLDMFTRTVAVEQEREPYPVKIISFAPGVVDTEMQAEIRRTKEEDFIQVQRFIDLKESGSLLDPEFVATKLVELLISDDFPQGALLDIRDNL